MTSQYRCFGLTAVNFFGILTSCANSSTHVSAMSTVDVFANVNWFSLVVACLSRVKVRRIQVATSTSCSWNALWSWRRLFRLNCPSNSRWLSTHHSSLSSNSVCFSAYHFCSFLSRDSPLFELCVHLPITTNFPVFSQSLCQILQLIYCCRIYRIVFGDTVFTDAPEQLSVLRRSFAALKGRLKDVELGRWKGFGILYVVCRQPALKCFVFLSAELISCWCSAGFHQAIISSHCSLAAVYGGM